MKIYTADFVKSAVKLADCPAGGRPEIAFAGRSNVGKSSLLNALLNRKSLAKTSKTPGKTRTLNYFDVNGRLYFVDLPGYGYAKAPQQLKALWGKAITEYLAKRQTLRLVAHLVDARHEPTERDHELLELLDAYQRPVVIIATKMDKVKKSQRLAAINRLRRALDLDEDVLIVAFSAVTREGVRPLWDVIAEVSNAQ